MPTCRHTATENGQNHMKDTFTTIGQYLSTVFLVAAIWGPYGCADSASVNPVVELASLTVTPGTLSPTFNGATTQYSVDLSSNIATVTVTAQPAVAGDTVTINGQAMTSHTITLNPAGSSTQVSIVVSESGTNSRTYTVLINRAGPGGNNSLGNLTVSPGTLTPAFNANALRYTVNVANSDRSITITPTLPNSSNATMTVEGRDTTSGQAQTFTLPGPGSSTIIDIIVTAQNGSQKIYLVTVNRGISGNNFLDSLTISPGTLDPPFSAGTTGYTVNLSSTLPGNPTSVTVTPTLQDLTASMSIRVNNGQPTNINSGEARSTPLPTPGSITFIAIVVTAQDGTQRTYTVNVVRDPLSGNTNLGSLTVVPGFLIPEFDVNNTVRTMFAVSVDSTVDSITVTAAPQDGNARLTINRQPTTSRTISLRDGPSSTEIEILVTPQNQGTPRRFTVTVTRTAPGAPAPPANTPDLTDASDSGISQTDNITNVLTPSFIVPQPAAGEIPNLYMAIGFIALEQVQSSFDAATNTLTPTNPLQSGDYFITVTSTVTNAAGLESPQSRPLTVHIDTVAP
jgi:hypothetical protein